MKKYQLNFYPRVFDPVDCQLSKLQLLNACIPPLSELPSGKKSFGFQHVPKDSKYSEKRIFKRTFNIGTSTGKV